MSFASLTIVGNVVKKPTLSRARGEDDEERARCVFTIAAHPRGKSRPLYMKCVAWAEVAEVVAEYIDTGKLVVAVGSLTPIEWLDKDGVARESVEMTVDTIKVLSPPKKSTRDTDLL